MNYAEAEEYINQIPRFSKVKSEENVDEILALFGHPEKKFAYIHVAGTNGKGSVCAFLDSMLRMAGKKTGLFTSPHLITKCLLKFLRNCSMLSKCAKRQDICIRRILNGFI